MWAITIVIVVGFDNSFSFFFFFFLFFFFFSPEAVPDTAASILLWYSIV